jgi:F-type H+-transporting ATPase subunit delta
MPRLDHTSPLAISYARSLLELAEERQQLQQIEVELKGLGEVIEASPTFRSFLRDPAIGETERADLLKRVFGGKISPLLMDFLSVVNLHSRLGSIEEIAQAYDDLLDERLGKIEVDVTVAQKLSPEDLEEVRRRVGAALKKDAVIHQYVDESIIGGMILRVQDQLIDASVRSQLQAIRQRMLSARLTT